MSDEGLEGIQDDRIKQLIQETRRDKEQLAADRAALEAERLSVGFDRAGVPETGPGLLFRESYKGDPSADAIRAAAERYGITGQPAATPPPAPSGPPQSDIDRMRFLQSAVGAEGQGPNREQEVLAKMMNADGPDELMEIVRAERLLMDTRDGARDFPGAPNAY